MVSVRFWRIVVKPIQTVYALSVPVGSISPTKYVGRIHPTATILQLTLDVRVVQWVLLLEVEDVYQITLIWMDVSH